MRLWYACYRVRLSHGSKLVSTGIGWMLGRDGGDVGDSCVECRLRL